jgi:hypothetical protein
VWAWEVNDTANRVRVTSRSGATRVYRLRQYEFANGDHFTRSVMEMGTGRLLVTHQHGAYCVSSAGRVLAELDHKGPRCFEVVGRSVRALGRTEGAYDHWLTARVWNGKTAIASADEGYVVLISPTLERTVALSFRGREVRSIEPASNRAWRLTVGSGTASERVYVSNEGSLRFLGQAGAREPSGAPKPYARTFRPRPSLVVTLRSSRLPDGGVDIEVRRGRAKAQPFHYGVFNDFVDVVTSMPGGSRFFLVAARTETQRDSHAYVWSIDTASGACRLVVDRASSGSIRTLAKGVIRESSLARWVTNPPSGADPNATVVRTRRFVPKIGGFTTPHWQVLRDPRSGEFAAVSGDGSGVLRTSAGGRQSKLLWRLRRTP